MKQIIPSIAILFISLTLSGGTAESYQSQIVTRINEYRVSAGLAPVRLDDALNAACVLHARYITANDVRMDVDFTPHEENPKFPGYTPEGKKAAENSIIINAVEPEKTVDYWMGTTFHRIPVLAPGLKSIGAGYAEGGRYKCVTLVDIFSDVGPADRDIVVYPGKGQKGVPVGFGLMNERVKIIEHPDPMPQDTDKVAGYPITVMFTRNQKVTCAAAVLKDAPGKRVPVWTYSPEHPAYDRDTQQNTITIIPRDYLLPDTRYTVSVEAYVNARQWRMEWSFMTAKMSGPDEKKKYTEKK
jgi:hypothetical protein